MLKQTKKNLVLIHGWGFGSHVWKTFIPYLSSDWCVECLALPGYEDQKKELPMTLEKTVERLSMSVPEGSVLLAWSLGGLLAIKLCAMRKDIKGLITIASSPVFINSETWASGVNKDDFENLRGQAVSDPEKGLGMFAGLVAMGDEHPKQSINKLRGYLEKQSLKTDVLTSGLDILETTDARNDLSSISCPMTMIFGENDILVKQTTAEAIKKINPEIQTCQIKNVGHAPFLSKSKETAAAIERILKTANTQ